MKAAYINDFGGPEVLQYGALNEPFRSDEEQIKVRVRFASINPVDAKTRAGNHRFILGKKFPRVLGYDFDGEVVEADSKDLFSIGDRVCGRTDNKNGGCYAQYIYCSAQVVSRIPNNIGFKEAAALPLAGCTALQALRDQGSILSGSNVVINGGSGGVGHLAIQIAKAYGAQVTAISSKRNEDLVLSLGANQWIGYENGPVYHRLGNCDLLFDAIGNLSYTSFISTINKGGSFIEILPRPKLLVWKLLSLLKNHRVRTLVMKSRSEDLDLLLKWMSEGKLHILIDKEFNLSEAQEAHEYLSLGRTKGKLILRIP